MVASVLEGCVAILVAIATAVFIFGQLKSSAERSAKDIDDIKVMMHEYQEDMKDMLSRSMTDMKALIDANKVAQNDSLSREVQHLRDLINMNNTEIRADIRRIEERQESVNHLRERFAIVSASLKSLHRRLDIEPPALLDSEENI
jgi:predicted  nucleic acid-binding Zn-ribbon protein